MKEDDVSLILPKYAQIPPSLLEGIQGCSRARSPFQWGKAGAGWKQAYVLGARFRLINGLFWQSGLFLRSSFEVRNRGVLRGFPGEDSGKRGLIRGRIGRGRGAWLIDIKWGWGKRVRESACSAIGPPYFSPDSIS